MNLTQRLTAAMIAGAALSFSATALAELSEPYSFQVAQQSTPDTGRVPDVNVPDPVLPDETVSGVTVPETTSNQPTVTNNITVPNPATPNSTAAAPPPQSSTRVEVRNQAAPNQQLPAPNIDISMPEMPDINVVAPADTGTTSQSITRTERFIFDDADDNDRTANANILYMAIFGILAVFLVAVIAMAASRRTLDEDLPQ